MGKNKNFKVEVKVTSYGNTILSIRHNRYQFHSININDPKHEIPVIVNALADYYLKELYNEKSD